MWLGRRNRVERGGAALAGEATVEGERVGVYLEAERRELPVYGPGGYCWRPALGQEVLVIKGGAAGEAPCVAAARCGGEVLAPGEVYISAGAGGASVRLCNDGSIALTGRVLVNGIPIEELGGGESGTDA